MGINYPSSESVRFTSFLPATTSSRNLEGFLSKHSALQVPPQPRLVRCFQNYKDTVRYAALGSEVQGPSRLIAYLQKHTYFTRICDRQKPREWVWVRDQTWGVEDSVSLCADMSLFGCVGCLWFPCWVENFLTVDVGLVRGRCLGTERQDAVRATSSTRTTCSKKPNATTKKTRLFYPLKAGKERQKAQWHNREKSTKLGFFHQFCRLKHNSLREKSLKLGTKSDSFIWESLNLEGGKSDL